MEMCSAIIYQHQGQQVFVFFLNKQQVFVSLSGRDMNLLSM